jgi:hypothetical protein
LHQPCDIIITVEEEEQIQANMNPIRLGLVIENQGPEGVHTPFCSAYSFVIWVIGSFVTLERRTKEQHRPQRVLRAQPALP